MILKRFYEDRIAQASFLLGCSGEAVIIDPNRDVHRYLEAARVEGLRIVAVTETHIHADFVSGSRELARCTGAALCVSAEGGPDWQYAFDNERGVRLLHHGESIRAGKIRLDILHTPGHTPEHLSFLLTDEATSSQPVGAFTGDFIFAGDVGRPDLLERAAGVAGTMEAGARELFKSLKGFSSQPDRLLLWPGHGSGSACGKKLGGMPVTTLGYEKLANWAFQIKDETEFVQAVLEDQPDPPRYFAEMKRVNRLGAGAPPCLPPHLAPEAIDQTIRSDRPAQIVDLRPAGEFAAGFIPGTFGIPLDKSFLNWAGALLCPEQQIYLIASAESAISEAARALQLIGLDDLAGWFDVGVVERRRDMQNELAVMEQLTIPQWQAKGQRQVVLDVRNNAEFRAGHIPGAIHIPLGRLPERASELPTDSQIVVHCQGGIRSPIAVSVLVKMGFRNVANLSGGFQDYQRHALPVETGLAISTLRG
jgi:hydroxyacylglutathione hydrolase